MKRKGYAFWFMSPKYSLIDKPTQKRKSVSKVSGSKKKKLRSWVSASGKRQYYYK